MVACTCSKNFGFDLKRQCHTVTGNYFYSIKMKQTDEIKRPQRPSNKRPYHKRNPSIGTLLNSKRYQQATPKHDHNSIIFPTMNNDDSPDEIDKAPKVHRMESVVKSLRIENSHVVRESNELKSKNALLERTLKHSKHQYSVLQNENKKLKNDNQYFKKRIEELKHKNKESDEDDDDNNNHDDMSMQSLKSHISSLEDTNRKSQEKLKKVHIL